MSKKPVVGDTVWLTRLQSEKYNNKFGKVVGGDQERADVKLTMEPDKIKRIRWQNLMPYPDPDAKVSPAIILKHFAHALAVTRTHYPPKDHLGPTDRDDVYGRIQMVQAMTMANRLQQSQIGCMEMECFLRSEPTEHMRVLMSYRFPCTGDGVVDFTRFGCGVLKPEDKEQRIFKRLTEWFISGFCERCQFAMFEGPTAADEHSDALIDGI